jgi:hypothetical protein
MVMGESYLIAKINKGQVVIRDLVVKCQEI